MPSTSVFGLFFIFQSIYPPFVISGCTMAVNIVTTKMYISSSIFSHRVLCFLFSFPFTHQRSCQNLQEQNKMFDVWPSHRMLPFPVFPNRYLALWVIRLQHIIILQSFLLHRAMFNWKLYFQNIPGMWPLYTTASTCNIFQIDIPAGTFASSQQFFMPQPEYSFKTAEDSFVQTLCWLSVILKIKSK